ncbi:MAG: hypothetical protein OHK0032_17660 [Thermodesulfovibrionales bacterium]
MPSATITVKGQTTIPKKIRNHLKLHPGDQIDFVIEDNGRVVIEPATLDVTELEGILHRPGMKAVSAEKMKESIKKRFRKK